jgi:O-antigen ligase
VLSRGRGRKAAAAAFAVLGFALILLADVRTAFITIALGVLLTIVFSPRGAISTTRIVIAARTLALAIIVGLVLISGVAANSALQSIPTLGQNARATNRLISYGTAISFFVASPLIGEGPGSAGATDQSSFGNGNHVTADNEFLALLTEGGLLGLIAIAAVVAACVSVGGRFTDPSHPSAAALYALLGFSLTVNAFEAAPVSVFLAVLVGLAVRRADVTSVAQASDSGAVAAD